MATHQPRRILVAPLDWGLGHTARCVPIIRYIAGQGHIPLVAGNHWQRSFIEETFGSIDFIHLEGYNIRYSGLNTVAQMGLLLQMPSVLREIRAENSWLNRHLSSLRIDGIISDNRYGLFHVSVPSVILTHQLQVRSGLSATADNIIRRLHYTYLNRFDSTWVADVPAYPGLAGDLSHAPVHPPDTKYIGLLSRFAGKQSLQHTPERITVLLSGPEPARTTFSRQLWQQVLHCGHEIVFVEGSRDAVSPGDIPPHISYHQTLTGDALEAALLASSMVICRSGYSTIMDLVALNKKAILVPTPGQTEQEYLAKTMHERGLFPSSSQSRFQLDLMLQEASAFPFLHSGSQDSFHLFEDTLGTWLNSL